MTENVLAQLAQIPTMEIGALKTMWRNLHGSEPPAYNRKYLETRLAYRVQELAYGGLKPETLKRLAALAEELEPRGSRSKARMPVAGTRLLREWHGVDHCVTVLAYGFEYQGLPYQSLSAIARAITGTRWNGWVFFGLRKQGQGR